MAGGIIGSLMYAVGFKFNSKGINDADKKVGKLTKTVVGLGAAGVAAMTGIGIAGVHAASKFETAMKQVQGATGATVKQMEATREVAKNLYSNNFGEDWNDLGTAISNVQQVTGQTGEELENTTRNAILLRDQFGFEIPESIKSADTMMRQFGITSEESYNLLAQGAQRGLDKSGELVDSANEYANQFKSLGFTADEMFDVFAAGSAEGVFQVDKVGDAVKEFNIRSKDASKTSMDAFTALGLNADAMMQTFAKGGPDAKQAFSDIVSMISDIEDPVARNNIGVALMGSQFEDLEVNVISAMGAATRSFDKTKKTMDELNKIKFEKPGEAFKMFGRQVEVGILIPIGQKLLPYLNAFGQWLSDHKPQIEAVGNAIGDGLGAAINMVSGWIQAAMPYLQQFGTQALQVFGYLIDKGKELWTSIQPVAVMIGETLLNAAVQLWPHIQQIGSSIADAAKAFYDWGGFALMVSGIVAALVTYKTVVGTITVATKIAAAATKAWTAIQKAFSIVMAANPIGIIIAALVGLGVGLVVAYKKSDKFRAFIDGMWSGIKTATMAVLNFFKITVPQTFMTAFNAVTGFLKTWGVTILVVIGGPIAWIVALVVKYWDEIKAVTFAVFSAIGSWLSSIWSSISSNISGAVSAVWNAITGAWNNVFSITNSLMTKVWNKITAIWAQIVGSIKTAGVNVWTAVSDMWGKVTSFFNGINLFDTGKKIISGLIDGISNMASTLMEKVKSIADGIKDFFGFKTSASVSVSTETTGIKAVDGSHANGLPYVPWDGYIGELHKGERVLTAKENQAYSQPEATFPKFDFPIYQMPAFELPDFQIAQINIPFAKQEPVAAKPDYEPHTPESSPARMTTNNHRADFKPIFNIKVSGNADDKTISNLRETIRQEMQDVFESYMRSVGLEGA